MDFPKFQSEQPSNTVPLDQAAIAKTNGKAGQILMPMGEEEAN
jgi:hypothetical protein